MDSRKYKCTVIMYITESDYIKISNKMKEILELHPEINSIDISYNG